MIDLVEAEAHSVLLGSDVTLVQLPALLVGAHLLQEFRPVHLYEHARVRPADDRGTVGSIEQDIVVSEDLPRAEQS